MATRKAGSKKSTTKGVSRVTSAAKKVKAVAKAVSRPAKLQLQLSPDDQARAIECLQKNGRISITLNAAQLVNVPLSKRIISRDCAWLID